MFGRKREPRQVYTEGELKTQVSNDNYYLVRALKVILCAALIVIIVLASAGFVYQYFIDPILREKVNTLIMQNISGIMFFVLSLIGIKVTKDKTVLPSDS